jgi:ribA/ribD-fused uncharacterized protein
MSVEVQQKPGWPGKFGSLLGKHRLNNRKSVAEKAKDAVSSEGHREAGVSGAGQLEETNPIQHVGGTGIVVNQPQEPLQPPSNFADEKPGESSQAPSLRRRRSDDEIQAADEASSEEQEDSTIPTKIRFYLKGEPYFWLSNSSEYPVYYDGIKYPTSEHLFQAMKFLPHRPDLATKVRKISSPNDAIKEARRNMTEVKKGWISKGINVVQMKEVLLLKFTQHSILRRQLLLTGDAEIVQSSPADAFWGDAAGTDGFGGGRNELGKALMRTRETIRIQAGLGIGSAAKTV